MEPEHGVTFHLSFVSGEGDRVAPAPDLVISEIKSRRYWDTAMLEPVVGQFPRLHLEFHEGHISAARLWSDGRMNCLYQTPSS